VASGRDHCFDVASKYQPLDEPFRVGTKQITRKLNPED